MKTLINLSFIPFLLLILVSCDRQVDRINRKYVIENSTNRTLMAYFYRDGDLNFSKGVVGSGILAEGKSTNDSGSNSSAFAAFDYSDSVVVTFDDVKRQVYIYPELNTEQRNILSDSSYQVENIELYHFSFTEEEYENADLIEE